MPARTEEIVKTISEVWRTVAGTVVRKKVEVGWGVRRLTRYAWPPFSRPDRKLTPPSLFFEILRLGFLMTDPTSRPVTIIGMSIGSCGIEIDSNNSANLYKANYSQ